MTNFITFLNPINSIATGVLSFTVTSITILILGLIFLDSNLENKWLNKDAGDKFTIKLMAFIVVVLVLLLDLVLKSALPTNKFISNGGAFVIGILLLGLCMSKFLKKNVNSDIEVEECKNMLDSTYLFALLSFIIISMLMVSIHKFPYEYTIVWLLFLVSKYLWFGSIENNSFCLKIKEDFNNLIVHFDWRLGIMMGVLGIIVFFDLGVIALGILISFIVYGILYMKIRKK